MSLFQIQVERQFLAGITTNLTPNYEKYLAYFGNPAIQANILEVIEEQYQGEFIRALFVDILGYTAQPHPNFNLIREKKNETDSKSADAAIIVNNQIVAVIELKDHKTQDLKKIETQAFGYKNNHKNCHYIVTSNFERLRFYIENAVDFIEFDLFNLTFDEFRRLWICLSYESIAKNLPQEIKNQSISSEDKVTKDLYKDYSVFKRLLFDNIVFLNPEHDKLLLFKQTQKLLDRFLFLFFAEDKELLPANSVKGTVDKWEKFNADPMNDYQSLYSRFVKYFKLLDTGYKDANTEIYAYNGGLFANDKLLNQIKVEDAVLSKNVLKIAEYNFSTEVDVNILGHIFENSLNEIEQVKVMLDSKTSSPLGRSGGVSKRKQDGVFYTPRYITQYIVENTVGRLCEEKKAELGIGEELFEYKRADKRKQALKVFDSYREWLLHITIVDPACGSGAFLNRALDFLIAEHSWIDRQQERITGLKGHYSMELSNIENTILENNLFGVDINDESVEIAKLSLWLRTAKPHRKLNSLNNNIKCGNSLIDDPAVAGEKAFDWHKEFPQIFQQKEKKAWHITTATHNSRYSQRMFDNYVKLGEPVWLTEEEELIITRTIAEIAVKDQLNILAYNICGDHMHIALVCEEEEVEKIVGKLKSVSARAANIATGRTIPATSRSQGHAPVSIDLATENSRTRGHAPIADEEAVAASLSRTRGHAPLSISEPTDAPVSLTRGETQTALWTQKFGCNEITSEEQLQNTIAYIRKNRKKHGLPELYNGKARNDVGTTNKGTIPGVEELSCDNNGACPIVIAPISETTVSDTLPVTDATLADSSVSAIPVIFPRTVSPEYAFRPEYKGGFDVVIGNPPYVNIYNMSSTDRDYFNISKSYTSTYLKYDLYVLFIEKGINILKENGHMSYIIPSVILSVPYGTLIREKIIKENTLNQIVDFTGFKVFADAMVETCILLITKKKTENNLVKVFKPKLQISDFQERCFEIFQSEFIKTDSFQFRLDLNNSSLQIIDKIKEKSVLLESIYYISKGIVAFSKIDDRKKDDFLFIEKVNDKCVPYLEGKDVNRYYVGFENKYLQYDINIMSRPTFPELHEKNKLLIRAISDGLNATYDNEGYYIDQKLIICSKRYEIESYIVPAKRPKSEHLNKNNEINDLAILALLNSKLSKYYYLIMLKGGVSILPEDIRNFPIYLFKNTQQQQPFISKADAMLSYNKELQLLVGKFQRMLQRKFELEELPGKLQNWYLLNYKEFIAELGKKKVKLTLTQESEWEEYFHAEQAKAIEIKKQIGDTDREIDRMVYELYELTEEEVKIVEGE